MRQTRFVFMRGVLRAGGWAVLIVRPVQVVQFGQLLRPVVLN